MSAMRAHGEESPVDKPVGGFHNVNGSTIDEAAHVIA
jgi:hypothetical protein